MSNKLPGLNGLRAIAASFVLFIHLFQIAGMEGDSWAASFYKRHSMLGTEMVNLFFVISGFIITYILFKEKNKTGTISLSHFYIKRILRIWPLYFGIIAIVFLLSKVTNVYDGYADINKGGFIILAFFIVTLRDLFYQSQISVLPHYWSLSVEEQFYIFWPPLFKFFSSRGVLIFSGLVIVVMVLLRNANAFLQSNYSNDYPWTLKAGEFLNSSKFGSVAMGVCGAWILVHKSSVLRILYNKYLQILCWFVFFIMIVQSFYVSFIHSEITAIICLVLVLNVTSNTESLLKLENKWLDRTGMISYGIYMFHWPLIPILIYFSKQLNVWEYSIQTRQLPLLVISYLITWGLAWLSFQFIESKFLRLKPTESKTIKPHNL